MSSGDRSQLSREVIAATALRLTDAEGLAGLSMRKLGAELGVEAMSLYHYVDSKDDLLDAVLDQLYRAVDLPRSVPDEKWEEAVRLGLRAFQRVLFEHPAALVLFSSRPAPSASSLEVVYWAFRRFEVMGLAPGDCMSAMRFAISFVMGHAANELGVAAATNRDPAEVEVELAVEDPDLQRFQSLVQASEPDALFEAGLDLVVAGLKSRFDLP